jgi:hypothetical protein
MKFRHRELPRRKHTRFGAFKMWHHIAGLVIQEISKEHSALKFRVKQSSLLELPDPEHEDGTFLLNTWNR